MRTLKLFKDHTHTSALAPPSSQAFQRHLRHPSPHNPKPYAPKCSPPRRPERPKPLNCSTPSRPREKCRVDKQKSSSARHPGASSMMEAPTVSAWNQVLCRASAQGAGELQEPRSRGGGGNWKVQPPSPEAAVFNPKPSNPSNP